MIDHFFQLVFSNVCISLALAIIAAIVGITLKRPFITHLLWLLVFVKLLTPPFLMISVSQNPWLGEAYPPVNFNMTEQMDMQVVGDTTSGQTIDSSPDTVSVTQIQEKHWFLIVWVIGSMAVLIWSTLHVFRFHRLLKKVVETGSPEIQSAAREIAACLGLKAAPTIHTISANISPMVWWIGGKVWVVIPTALIKQMNDMQFQWILSHELAHVHRRDYMIRWIEWLVCVSFWWNPVTWWARYNLRANEELCCDALVLSRMKPKPYTYGDSLVKAVEILRFPTQQPLAIASGINNDGLLKERVKRIVSNDLIKSKLRWLQACIMLGALLVLPLGLTNAHVYSTKEKIPEFIETSLKEVLPKLKEQQSINEKEVRTEKLVASVLSTEKVAKKQEQWEGRETLAPALSREISNPDDVVFKETNETKRTVLTEVDNQKTMKTPPMKPLTAESSETASTAIEDGDEMAAKNSSEMLLNSPKTTAPLSIMDTNNETDGKTFLASEVDTPPELLREVLPIYPYRAKKNNYEGRITLQFVVTKDGNAVDARVIGSEPPEVKEVFEESALKALEQYRFEPAMKNGKAVDVSGVNLPISFTLTSGKDNR